MEPPRFGCSRDRANQTTARRTSASSSPPRQRPGNELPGRCRGALEGTRRGRCVRASRTEVSMDTLRSSHVRSLARRSARQVRPAALPLGMVGLALVAVVGCPVSATAPPAPIAREDFCAELIDARCDVVERCACGAASAALCRSDLTIDCAPEFSNPEVEASIAAGRLVYDPLAAGRLVARIRSEPPLCSDSMALGFRLRDVIDFGGALVGAVEPGAPCSLPEGFPNECHQGLCFDGTCIAIHGLGEACGPTLPCLDLDAPYVLDFDGSSPPSILRCASGTCQALLPAGETCTRDEECATFSCAAGRCAAPIAVGGICDFDVQCATHRCGVGRIGERACIAGDAPDGAACTFEVECASHGCGDGICMTPLCATWTTR